MNPVDHRRYTVLYEAGPGSAGERRLQELGLDVPTIHEVLLYANAEQATYTVNDAPGGGEYARWSRHIRRLTELLVPRGWERINPDHQPTLVHPDRRRCLVVTSGSSATGVSYATPSTKNPKGRTIRDAVQDNAALALLRPQDLDNVLAGLRETWMLLTFVTMDRQIRSEVSLPSAMDGEQITAWEHRILIPAVDPASGPDRGDEEEPPDYDFDVVRK